ncbi:MAG: precorrin-6A reductase [Blautia sp.]|nr:precorrin-6A reductase [Blautia sp.]
MYKVIVFAGTTEGYDICRFLKKHGIRTCACVATDYGTRSLTENEDLTIRAARLTEEEMHAFFLEEQPELVIDATHPYAAVVTENIREACKDFPERYVRVLRQEGEHTSDAVYVENTEAAVEYLKNTTGNVLLTTGSKELKAYTEVPDYENRLYARVLSLPGVMTSCAGLGFEGKHLIGMQGPFSRELNEAMLRQLDCRYLVTKDTGAAGGFQEKIEAAHACGTIPVIIGRPTTEEGISVRECKKLLSEHFSLTLIPRVTLLGIGMGSPATLTQEALEVLSEADLVIGARRMADAVRQPHHEILYEYRSDVIAAYIREHPWYEHIVIALSGDVGFYSGARKLLDLLGPSVRVVCGISSVVYFMAKTGHSWDDAKIVSAHGRSCNLIPLIRHNRKVFSILGTTDGVRNLAKKLVTYGMGDVLLYVGENLSYKEEKVFCRKACELTEYEGDALSVILAYNENAVKMRTTHGLPDEEFLRGKAPMTKEEVRTVSLSKLQLTEDSICYDIGAGTGSVSIEMALRASQGKVYAIEKKDDALEILGRNKEHFAADNMEIIAGTAPDAMEELQAPTHAFIGGSSGNLDRIVQLLLSKNPHVRIVINCITLETVSEALAVIREHSFTGTDVVMLSAARSKEIGRYHMMMGENPIYIITLQG